jgi:hypothetical protein
MSAAQSEFAKVPVHVVHHHIHVHHHPYPSTAPLSATTSEFDLEFVLGSPAGFRKAKKARRDF